MSTAKLLVAAIVLVILVFLFANPFEDAIRKDNPERTELYADADLEGVDRLEIVSSPGGEKAVLELRGDAWVVASRGGFPADTTAVGTMLRALRNAKVTGTASTNPENRGKYQVDSTGVQVAVFSGDREVARFVLGRIGQDFTTSYVRLEGSDEVLVVRGMNRNVFARTQGYRDRTLFRFEIESVQSVQAVTPDGAWEVSRGDTAWVASSGVSGETAPAQEATVDQMLRALSTLSADGFLDQPADTLDTGLDDPEYAFTVRFMNGSESRIEVGNKNESNQRYVTVPGREVIYLMGDWRVNNIAKSYEDLTAAS